MKREGRTIDKPNTVNQHLPFPNIFVDYSMAADA
jgi:hypothetical protein